MTSFTSQPSQGFIAEDSVPRPVPMTAAVGGDALLAVLAPVASPRDRVRRPRIAREAAFYLVGVAVLALAAIAAAFVLVI